MDLATVRTFLVRWESLLAGATVVIIVIAAATTPDLLSAQSTSGALQVMAEKALFVLPLTLLIIAREIDISVASVAAFSATVAAVAMEHGVPLVLTFAIALLVGAVCGAVNGACVAFLGMPSLVVTLGSLALFRGLCYVVLGGTPVTDLDPGFVQWSIGNLTGTWIPAVLLPMIVLTPIFAVVLHRRPVGRHLYALGGGPDVARYAGTRVRRLKFGLFVVSGLVSAIAGLLFIGRTTNASPDAMLGYELDAITVVFLGGVSFLGGKGRLSGVLWALLLVVVVRQTLLFHGQGQYAQGTAVGILLIASLLLANLSLRVSASLSARRVSSEAAQESPPPLGA